jgi:MFS family permease
MADLREKPPDKTLANDSKEAPSPETAEPEYSIFSRRHKRLIISLVAFVGWFSSLSSFIYFPVITALAESLSTTISKINLTVTAYLAVSAVAPAIAGDLADYSGRRPVFLGMLSIYVAANIGLAVQRSYAALVVLRMLQSAGISGAFVHSWPKRLCHVSI